MVVIYPNNPKVNKHINVKPYLVFNLLILYLLLNIFSQFSHEYRMMGILHDMYIGKRG